MPERPRPGTGHPRAALRCPAAPAAGPGRECPTARDCFGFLQPFSLPFGALRAPRAPPPAAAAAQHFLKVEGALPWALQPARCSSGPRHPPSRARHRQPEGYFGKHRFTPLDRNPRSLARYSSTIHVLLHSHSAFKVWGCKG